MTAMHPTLETTQAPKKRRRVALWATVLWTVLMAVWLIAGAGGAGSDCANQAGDKFLSAQDAQAACEAGAGFAGLLIVGVWAFGLFAIMAITVIVRLGNRD